MCDETKHIFLLGSAGNAIVEFTIVAQNVSAFCPHKCSKMLMPLVSCIVNDAVVHTVPNVQQTLLQFINAVQLRLMHLLLDVTSYHVISWINVGCCLAVTDLEEQKRVLTTQEITQCRMPGVQVYCMSC